MPLGANKAAIMGVAGVSTGDVVLLHDTDYSNASTASITSGIDSTYGEYIFKFYNINPATDDADFTFQTSTDGGSNYNLTLTSTVFFAYQTEDNSSNTLSYLTAQDQAQGTAFQSLHHDTGNAADECCVGELHLFNPASTTYVKHWYARFAGSQSNNIIQDEYSAGYFNTTSDIDAVQFKMASGNFDGTIKMWGVK